MTTIETEEISFIAGLPAAGRSPEIPDSGDVYEWLQGSWELDAWRDQRDGSFDLNAEPHFGWVLERRAVQDVWIMPRRSDRKSELTKAVSTYGTTWRLEAEFRGRRMASKGER